jgi:hypothetical protein
MDYRTFPCPGCRQIIDTTMQSCRFCGVVIDPAAAAAAATLQERVQKACSQATSARITAMAMPVLFLLSFVPFIGVVGLAGIVATLFIVPWNLIQWRRRFGKLESPDPDLPRARRALKEAALAWAAMVIVNALYVLYRFSPGGQPKY